MRAAAALAMTGVGVALNLRRARTSTARPALQRRRSRLTAASGIGTAVMLLKPPSDVPGVRLSGDVGPCPARYSRDLPPHSLSTCIRSALRTTCASGAAAAILISTTWSCSVPRVSVSSGYANGVAGYFGAVRALSPRISRKCGAVARQSRHAALGSPNLDGTLPILSS